MATRGRKATGGSTERPMMQQYLALRAQVPDALLLFRLGDFYELFMEDARTAAPLLDLVLTSRDRDVPDPIPMCGIPVHALEGYVRRLVQAGYAVAIAEQVEDARAKAGRGLVRREIVEVVTPGLVANPDRLEGPAANYVAAVYGAPDGLTGIAYLDVSTGEFGATQTSDGSLVQAELARIGARELVFRELEKERFEAREGREDRRGVRLTARPEEDFDPARVAERSGRDPPGVDAGETTPQARAAAALWRAVAELQPFALERVQPLRRYALGDRLLLDPSTRRHLELFGNLQDGGRHGTLIDEIDRTRTPLGSRRLVRWIGEPLVDPAAIRARQDRVAAWLEPDSRRRALAEALDPIGDLERQLSRACLPTGVPRVLAALRASLEAVAPVRAIVELETPPEAADAPAARLRAALVDEPPNPPRGEPYTGYVRDGVDPELDTIRTEAEEGERYFETLEAREREATGIPTLRVRYNRVFGYSIEVTKTHLARVPERYRRKQTTANAERYVTDELERWEGVVRKAREGAADAEQRVLESLRAEVRAAAPAVQALASELAELDAAQSLADVARARDYVRPEVSDAAGLEIEAGRHPVVERFTPDGFVPNDVALDPEDACLLILTGPNMAGKSTLLRQVALIVLLAQAGSWVPARSARIGVADRIFTRVGASDSLTTGESTFMVEMRETAAILAEATPRSLVLLDEIGRGTSTFDGLSIAWSVAEYLHDQPGLRPRALFATHYHELADLARTKSGVRNFHFAVAQTGADDDEDGRGEILFLRRMEPGAASRSYGIEVARRAGLPPQVVGRAREILANLEGEEFDEQGQPRLAREPRPAPAAGAQLEMFRPARDPLRDAIRRLEPETMTPIEALAELDRLKRSVEEE